MYGDYWYVILLAFSSLPKLTHRQRAVAHTFQVQPINQEICVARTALLTRHIRVVMRAFNNNRRYGLNVPPRIEWDDTFVPPDLYPTLPAVPEAHSNVEETTEIGQRKGSSEDRRAVDKGKGKEKAGDEAEPLPATKAKEKRKRKVVSPETVENSDEEGIPAAVTTARPARACRLPAIKQARPKRKAATKPTAPVGPPPPCTRCVLYKVACRNNGWKAACQTCCEVRQKCSLAKTQPNAVSMDDAPSPVAGPSNPQPTIVRIVIPRALPRTIAAERSLPRGVPPAPSPPGSERGSHVLPTPTDLPSTSHLPSSGHLPKDPPAAS